MEVEGPYGYDDSAGLTTIGGLMARGYQVVTVPTPGGYHVVGAKPVDAPPELDEALELLEAWVAHAEHYKDPCLFDEDYCKRHEHWRRTERQCTVALTYQLLQHMTEDDMTGEPTDGHAGP